MRRELLRRSSLLYLQFMKQAMELFNWGKIVDIGTVLREDELGLHSLKNTILQYDQNLLFWKNWAFTKKTRQSEPYCSILGAASQKYYRITVFLLWWICHRKYGFYLNGQRVPMHHGQAILLHNFYIFQLVPFSFSPDQQWKFRSSFA